MKKRILAMLLVLCLVASVMPMTVLAAPADCPKEHNLNNCEATFVQSVAATNCSDRSYDLYRCNACGKLFAENFGDYGPHELVYEDGVDQFICKAGMVCRVPGCYEFDWDHYEYYTVGHAYDCAGKCYCGTESKDPADFGHDWDNKNAVIIEAPVNCTEAGLAEITCKSCGEKKTAAVYGVHAWGAPVAPKDKTCVADGNYCYRKCANCDAYQIGIPVLDSNGKFTYDVSGNLIADFNEKIVALKDVIIPASHDTPIPEIKEIPYTDASWELYVNQTNGVVTVIIETVNPAALVYVAHKDVSGNNAEPVKTFVPGLDNVLIYKLAAGEKIVVHNNVQGAKTAVVKVTDLESYELLVPSTCYIEGRYQVKCPTCQALVTVAIGTAAHDWHLQASQPATCISYGYEVYACVDCGRIETVTKEPLNCYDTYEEYKAYLEKLYAGDKTGLESALASIYTAPKCVTPGSYKWTCPICVETATKLLATGKAQDAALAAQLMNSANKTEIIPALGCDLKTETIPATIHHAGATYTYCARGAKCDCAPASNCLLMTSGVCTCGHHDMSSNLIAVDMALYQIVAAKGQKVHKILSTTAKLADNALNADAHDWVERGSTATCKDAGEIGYICSVCYKTKTVPGAKKPHVAFDEDRIEETLANGQPYYKVTVATCTENGKIEYWCETCEAYIKLDTLYYNPLVILNSEDAAIVHHNIGAITWLNAPTANDPADYLCKNVVYGVADCADCKGRIIVSLKNSGSHVYAPNFKLPDPTCETQTGSELCLQCQQLIAWEVKGQHKLPNPEVKGDCYTVGYDAWGECSVCHEFFPQKPKEGTGEHKPVSKYDYVASCTKWGGNLYVCSVCGLSEIYNYIPEHHDYVLNTEKSDKYAGCMASGTQYWECSKCDAEYSLHLEGLGYHVNTYGFKIDYSACPDCNKAANPGCLVWNTVEGAGHYDCIYCGQKLENLGRKATCMQDGYELFGWTCGHNGSGDYLPKKPHDYQPKSYGIYTCKECVNGCGAQKDLKSTGDVELFVSSELNKGQLGQTTDDSIIAITISMAAYKTDLFGYSFILGYQDEYLEFVDFEVLTENFKYNALVKNNVVDKSTYDAKGNLVGEPNYVSYVSVIGQSKTDGKNVNLSGTDDLVTLYFKVVNANKAVDDITSGAGYGILKTWVDCVEVYQNVPAQNGVILNKVDAIMNLNDGMAYPKFSDVNLQYYIENESDWIDNTRFSVGPYLLGYAPVWKLMDANFDGVVNYKDAATVWQMASGALAYNYSANLDLNGNGEIDHVDAKLIYQYHVGILTYEEVLNYGA